MKKISPLLLAVLIFLLGAGSFFYPFLASWLYQRSALKVQVEYKEKVSSISDEELNNLLEAAQEYNEALLNAGVVLTEPFDSERFDIDAMYMKLPTENAKMGYLSIPSLELSLPIYHTTSNEVLALGAGHMAHTSLPIGGESTHAAISAHSGLPNAEMFTHLSSMKIGNLFTIDILGRILTYKVYDIETVLPDQVESLAIQPNEDLVTLITCTPLGVNSHRLLVHGTRVKDEDVEQLFEQEPELDSKLTYTDYMTYAAIISIILFILLMLLVLFSRYKSNRENKLRVKN